ncbi:MAG TPA: P-loop NTPase, partial [Candidatus Thermoplasmatota archaeon]|nr:P-loop NTPase [Candidatus Thermoplasmatota archaeon]
LELPVLGVIENMSGLTLRGRTAPNTEVRLETGHESLAARSDAKGDFQVVVEVFKRGGGQAMAERLGVPFLGSVPLDPMVMHGGDEGKPFALRTQESPAGAAFRQIVAKLTAGH